MSIDQERYESQNRMAPTMPALDNARYWHRVSFLDSRGGVRWYFLFVNFLRFFTGRLGYTNLKESAD